MINVLRHHVEHLQNDFKTKIETLESVLVVSCNITRGIRTSVDRYALHQQAIAEVKKESIWTEELLGRIKEFLKKHSNVADNTLVPTP